MAILLEALGAIFAAMAVLLANTTHFARVVFAVRETNRVGAGKLAHIAVVGSAIRVVFAPV